MEIKQLKNLELKNIAGDFDSTTSSIKDASFIIDLLTRGMYSNSIGSIVREITSNCFDSHTEAGVNEPVIIKKGEDEEGVFISFNDYGVGLSPERIKTIFINYGESTKRTDNTLIGGFGLGSKSPLSYTDAFYIITNFDKVKYTYVFSKGVSLPTLDLLTEEDTTERNGTEIKIHIKNANDEAKFRVELISQLAYFDNVYFIGWNINNEYKVYEGKYFRYRSISQYSETMHILLGKVAYPINWEAIDMKPLGIAVGVKFDIGELEVTPNRESLMYTEAVTKIVKERVTLAFDELIDMFKTQNIPYESFRQFHLNRETRACIAFGDGEIKEHFLYLNNIKDLEKGHKYKYFAGIRNLNKESDILRYLYTFQFQIIDGKVYDRSNENATTNILGGRKILISENKVTSGAKNFYHQRGHVYKRTIRRFSHRTFISNFKDNISDSYKYYNFGNGKTHFLLGSAMILYQAIKKIREEVEINFIDYNTIPSEAYKTYTEFNRKHNMSLQRRLEGKVFCKDISTGGEYDWKLADQYREVFIKGARRKRDLVHGINSYKGLVIYGFRDDKHKLYKAEQFLLNFSTLRDGDNHLNRAATKVILISQTNEKYFKNKPNMVNVNNLYSDHKMFRRLASCYKIENFFINYLKYQTLNADNFIEEISKICEGTGELLKILTKYRSTYYRDSRNEGVGNNPQLKEEILDVAESFNLFDPIIENILGQVNEWFSGVEILKYTEINEDSLPAILMYLREKKKKLNYDYYCQYIPEVKERIIKDENAQIIMLFDDEEQKKEEPQTKFKILTKNIA